ncbi:MAG: tRNA (adenosine(37)-N6)-threonylcarbamoyltransferase complex dimerization subunit type 1 TsaB [Candidatus Omnitrophota bacterium]|nr:MAG: tRNA (adenosine(37)-N6)-threonylcarbamoyltransferase complex dimerization subunit type 1 TsaB [Candidatus Omnitrophota bacterium]
MKILGIDTTTKFLSVGFLDGNKICEYNLEMGRAHCRLLAPTLKRILRALKVRLKDIDYFACATGPGSFTGIRVGMAAVKAIAWSLNKPIIGISSLDILARNLETSNIVVPLIDARRNLIYSSAYNIKGNFFKRIKPYMLLSIAEFIKKFKQVKVTLLGDALNLYKDTILENLPSVNILDNDYWYPKGRSIVSLACQRIESNKIESAFSLKPIYLYPKECQIKEVDKK